MGVLMSSKTMESYGIGEKEHLTILQGISLLYAQIGQN